LDASGILPFLGARIISSSFGGLGLGARTPGIGVRFGRITPYSFGGLGIGARTLGAGILLLLNVV